MGFRLHDCNSYIRLVFCDVHDPAGVTLKVEVTTSYPYNGDDYGSQWRTD